MSRKVWIEEMRRRLAALEEEDAREARRGDLDRRERELAARERALQAREKAVDKNIDPVSRLYQQHAMETGLVTPYGAPVPKNTMQEIMAGEAFISMPPERPADPNWRDRIEPGTIRKGSGRSPDSGD